MRLFTIIVACLFSITSFSQTVIYEVTKPQSFEFKYSSQANNNELNANNILEQISSENQKNIFATKYNFKYNCTYRIKQLDTNKYNLTIELKDFSFAGEVSIRNINIEHLLVPDLANFSIIVNRKNGNNLNKVVEETFESKVLENNFGYITLLDYPFQDTSFMPKYSVSLENLRFYYSNKALEQFRSKVSLIETYYNADTLITRLHNSLQNIDLNQITKVAFNNVIVKEIENQYNKLLSLNLEKELYLWNNDPINYQKRLSDLEKEINRYKTLLNTKLEKLELIYYEQAMNYCNTKKIDSCLFFLNKSIEYNPRYLPALIERTKIEIENDDYVAVSKSLVFMATQTKPDAEQKEKILSIAKEFYSEITNLIESHFSKEDYLTAFENIELLENVCGAIKELNCKEHCEVLKSKAHYGMYYSFLTVVEKAIEYKKFEIASIYIKSATDYQAKNKRYILNNKEALNYYQVLFNSALNEINNLIGNNKTDRAYELTNFLQKLCDTVTIINNCNELQIVKQNVVEKVFINRIQKIERLIANKNYASAEKEINELEKIFAEYPHLKSSQQYLSVKTQLSTVLYQNAISLALQSLKLKNEELAYNYFLEALELKKNASDNSINLNLIARKTVARVISRKIESLLNDKNKYTAHNFYTNYLHFNNLINSFEISDTIIISETIKKLKNEAESYLCDSIKNHQKKEITAIEKSIKNQKFIQATSQISKLELMKENYPFCSFDEELLVLKQNLEPAVQWEEMMNEVKIRIGSGDYFSAFELYENAAKHALLYKLYEFNVVMPPLSDYVISLKNEKISFALFDYLFKQKKYDECFLILKQLQELKVDKKLTITQQKQLGEKMAIRDKINSPNSKYQINILRLTEGDSYFSYFSKAYSKTWLKYKYKIF